MYHYRPYQPRVTYAQPVSVLQNLMGRHIQFYGDVTGRTYIGRLIFVGDTGDPATDYIEVEVYLPPDNRLQVMTFYTHQISEAVPYTGPIPPYQPAPPPSPAPSPSPGAGSGPGNGTGSWSFPWWWMNRNSF
ncbi:hypothetical protein [Alteribacillus iranensis]|uniref:Uncharacterized protein n=1 Tax=Alteribacillus iranensis TaxID=930128 RepID=A0A1I2CW80_9BACI|nr:hypothetical protein [Alteribacillus iranensis]SFE72544.1 hypothetical protein SAMN05192532_103244 [Alteribacillus iranensis]